MSQWFGQPARTSAALLVAFALILSTAPRLPGQNIQNVQNAQALRGTAGGEWPTYGGDLGHTRYAPLDQINAANFSKLEVAWRFKTDNLGPRPEFNLESTPLMVNGRSTRPPARAAPSSRSTRPPASCSGCTARTKARAARPRRGSSPGAASPTGPTAREERILYVTPGYRLVALDAKTGNPVPGFGTERRRRSEARLRPGARSDQRRRSACTPRRSSPATS